jgi:hypothetical protein
MKHRFWLFKRRGIFYVEDKEHTHQRRERAMRSRPFRVIRAADEPLETLNKAVV